jgi:hypothetical protein
MIIASSGDRIVEEGMMLLVAAVDVTIRYPSARPALLPVRVAETVNAQFLPLDLSKPGFW